MDVKFIDGETILDLTVNNNSKSKAVLATDEIILLENSFIININKSIPKTKTRVRNHAVNVYYLYCTCKSYRESIKKFPKRDIRRICKHLFLAISSHYIEKYDELTRLMIESNFWYSHREIFKLKLNQEVIYLAFSFEKEIVNLFIKRNEWQLFTFEINSKEWLKKIPPTISETDEQSIKNYILYFYKEKKNEFITQI